MCNETDMHAGHKRKESCAAKYATDVMVRTSTHVTTPLVQVSEHKVKSTNSKTRGGSPSEIALNPQYERMDEGSTMTIDSRDFFSIFVDVCEAQGKRPYMEDFNLFVRDPKTGVLLAIVCDGHGKATWAREGIKHIANTLMPLLINAQLMCKRLRKTQIRDPQLPSMEKAHFVKVEAHLKDALLGVDEYMYKFFGQRMDVGGSTFVAFAMLPEVNEFVVMNVGDSKLLISDKSGKPNYGTFVAKPSHEGERKRIQEAHGFVSLDNRVNGVLAVSRAFGDYKLKLDAFTKEYKAHGAALTCMPEVICIKLDDNIKWVLLMSDGITDVLSDTEILEVVEQANQHQYRPADALVNTAYRKRSSDNMTALILYFVPNRSHSLVAPSAALVPALGGIASSGIDSSTQSMIPPTQMGGASKCASEVIHAPHRTHSIIQQILGRA
jgi:serine/threonine protein phosphatase PrpC